MSIRNRIAASFITLVAVALLAGPQIKGSAQAAEQAAPVAKQEVKKAGSVLPKGVTVITTDELKVLVEKGSEAGNYLLFDSRPAGRFHAATIPISLMLPDTEMVKLDKEGKAHPMLGQDKNKLQIFWCGGPT